MDKKFSENVFDLLRCNSAKIISLEQKQNSLEQEICLCERELNSIKDSNERLLEQGHSY